MQWLISTKSLTSAAIMATAVIVRIKKDILAQGKTFPSKQSPNFTVDGNKVCGKLNDEVDRLLRQEDELNALTALAENLALKTLRTFEELWSSAWSLERDLLPNGCLEITAHEYLDIIKRRSRSLTRKESGDASFAEDVLPLGIRLADVPSEAKSAVE